MLNYIEKPTKDPKLFRLVDEKGNWNHYVYHQSKKTKKYLRSVNYILRNGFAKGQFFEEWLKNHSAEEIEKRLNEAGTKGDMVHRLAEILHNDGKITRQTEVYDDELKKDRVATHDEWDCMISFAHFINSHKAKIMAMEIPLYNLKKGYAGTTDELMILNQACGNRYCKCKDYIGKLGLYDTKSGGEWSEHGPQLGAYAGCAVLSEYHKGKKLEYTANLYLGRKTEQGYKLTPYNLKETVQHQKEFIASTIIHDSTYQPFNDEAIYNTPDELSIEK